MRNPKLIPLLKEDILRREELRKEILRRLDEMEKLCDKMEELCKEFIQKRKEGKLFGGS